MSTKLTFEQLNLKEGIVRALDEIGFETPFPIQEVSIPLILEGFDIIGQAHTGTGKTAAFSLPILSKIRPTSEIQALILVPTRELALQIKNEITRFAKYTDIKITAIYGGQSVTLQQKQLKRGTHIVVATPGRLIDFINRNSIELERIDFVILDEADRMLDMGFIDDIKFILSYLKKESKQTCLFSATMPSQILKLAQEYMKKTFKSITLNEELSLSSITQSYLIVKESEKFKHLCKLITEIEKEQDQMIIFVSTKNKANSLTEELCKIKSDVITIHGDLSQRERESTMLRFRKGMNSILVATDIAARGIDIPAVGQVINYDIPEDPMTYFHRIGRTARAGGSGRALSLVSIERINDFERILRSTNQPIRKLNFELGIDIPATDKKKFTSMEGNRHNNRIGNRNRNTKSNGIRKSRSFKKGKKSHGHQNNRRTNKK